MNKQEKEELITFVNRAKEDLNFSFRAYHKTCPGYVQGNKLINYIEHLYEQQKVKVPKCVAAWIKWNKGRGGSVFILFDIDKASEFEEHQSGKGLLDWMINYRNHDLLIRAWLDGYEVEEEPKYYIQLPETTWGTYLVKGEDNELFVWQNATCGTRFTEDEIKSIDERYWPLAVPVEKV